jgi:hypothetical protein
MQEYINVDQRIHLLCQVLAKINRNFVTEKEDFSHSTLSFDPLGERIVCHWIKAKKGNFILALDLREFSFIWLNEAFQIIQKYAIADKRISTLENEISSDFESLGIGENGFAKNLKYKITNYSFTNEKFQTFESPTVNKWIYYRNVANEACDRFVKHLMAEEEIRIWPHHFDTGVFKEIDGKIGIGFGLAMQDSLVDSPYFYLSGYLLEGELSFENLPPLKFGKWDIGEWNGAVLPINEIDNLSDTDKRNAIDEFIKSALNWYWNSTLK